MARMIHGDFKVGEICQTSGLYECRVCSRLGREARVTMHVGGTFPQCASCTERGVHEVDTVWERTKL